MAKPKRKFIEGHSYFEMYNFTRFLSFWELEESYKAMKKYMEANNDIKIPVCVRLKQGDIRVKKYDEQIGLDPRDYYSNAQDLDFVVEGAYKSRLAMRDRFLEDKLEECKKFNVADCNPVELLNLRELLENMLEDWIYLDKHEEGFFIIETVDPEVIRTIHKYALPSLKRKNEFLAKYVLNEETRKLDKDQITNLVNHFRPVDNVLEEVYIAIESL